MKTPSNLEYAAIQLATSRALAEGRAMSIISQRRTFHMGSWIRAYGNGVTATRSLGGCRG